MRYTHALLFNSELGIMDGLMPDAFSRCPHLFKANTHDPDTPTFFETMAGPYKAEFKKAMQKEIDELTEHNTWTLVPKSTVPEEILTLPSTWAFKIKCYPDG